MLGQMDSYILYKLKTEQNRNIVFDINFTVWLLRSLFYDTGLNNLQLNLYSLHLRYYK